MHLLALPGDKIRVGRGTAPSDVGLTWAQEANRRVRYSPHFCWVTAHGEIGI